MITTFYICVLIRLNRIRNKHQSEIKQRSHRKVTRIVLAVITAYFICWVPYWFLQIFITIDPLIHSLRLNFSILPANTSMRFLKELTHLTTIIGYANNCLNPVLYVFLSESFREEYLIVLKCFDPSSLFTSHTFRTETYPQQTFELDRFRQTVNSIPNRSRQSEKIKMKHSVAIDEIPSQFRSFTHYTENENPLSETFVNRLSPESTAENAKRRKSVEIRPVARTSRLSISKTSIKDANGHQKGMLMVALSLSPTRTKPLLLDDGGVYCGN